MRSLALLALITPVLATARPARAFLIETPVTASCHEDITAAAIRRAGFPDRLAAPAPTEDQRRAMNDLTFTLPSRDVWTMAMLFGVRSNDIRDFAPTDVTRIGTVHNDPADQPAHCIRRSEDDGSAGDLGALEACKKFILDELDAGGMLDEALDLASLERVHLFLAIRGRISIDLPRFAYRVGRALHAVQDGYTHVFRTQDTGDVTHVLNWIDFIGDYDEARDGYHHIVTLDDCRREDSANLRRVERAVDASARLLAAIGDPAPGRRARVEATLDSIFAYAPGCDVTNAYCSAIELEEEDLGCTIAGGSIALVIVVLAFAIRRRKALLLVLALAPATARADLRWHFDSRIGASLDETAAAASVGAGVDWRVWTLGAQIEWNPWVSLDAEKVVAGSFNAYVTLARRWYVRPELQIYSRAEVGTSTILFELVGIDQYSTGIYYGGVLVGLRIPIKRCVDLTIDPSHLAMPTPRLLGSFPFWYGQWRLTIGIEARL